MPDVLDGLDSASEEDNESLSCARRADNVLDGLSDRESSGESVGKCNEAALDGLSVAASDLSADVSGAASDLFEGFGDDSPDASRAIVDIGISTVPADGPCAAAVRPFDGDGFQLLVGEAVDAKGPETWESAISREMFCTGSVMLSETVASNWCNVPRKDYREARLQTSALSLEFERTMWHGMANELASDNAEDSDVPLLYLEVRTYDGIDISKMSSSGCSIALPAPGKLSQLEDVEEKHSDDAILAPTSDAALASCKDDVPGPCLTARGTGPAKVLQSEGFRVVV